MYVPFIGEDAVLMLFVRNKLGWGTATYAEYGTFRMLIAFAGTYLTSELVSTQNNRIY